MDAAREKQRNPLKRAGKGPSGTLTSHPPEFNIRGLARAGGADGEQISDFNSLSSCSR